MARPKSADPETTRSRIVAAARDICVSEGMAALSARAVAEAAGVAPTTVCALFDGMRGLQMRLIGLAFEPLLDAFDFAESGDWRSVRDIAVGPLRKDPTLPRLVTQVGAFAGLTRGAGGELARKFALCWEITRKHLAEDEIPHSPLRAEPDQVALADEIVASYFSAAFNLARAPDIRTDRLRMRAA